MIPQHLSSRALPRPRFMPRLAALLALTLVGLFPSVTHSEPAAVPSLALPAAAGTPYSALAVQPLAADWVDTVLDPIVKGMHGRQRMIQVGAVMMVLALAVIWWRK